MTCSKFSVPKEAQPHCSCINWNARCMHLREKVTPQYYSFLATSLLSFPSSHQEKKKKKEQKTKVRCRNMGIVADLFQGYTCFVIWILCIFFHSKDSHEVSILTSFQTPQNKVKGEEKHSALESAHGSMNIGMDQNFQVKSFMVGNLHRNLPLGLTGKRTNIETVTTFQNLF